VFHLFQLDALLDRWKPTPLTWRSSRRHESQAKCI
jgi:hypothetical protein